jgi:UDP-N-acetylmuramoyl-L-alanyl-D-glutamate--2,6-diaminopimelate ligase
MIRLSALLAALPPELAPLSHPSVDPGIRGITTDSRAVAPGDLFVALRGAHADGHDYLAQAAALGAVALLVESAPEGALPPAAVVADTRRALAPIAVRFFGDPASELTLVGVTGTNGKTSTTFLTESILSAAGRATGLIGTVEVRYAGERQRAINTTPESLELQRLLRDMRTRGVAAAVMEVSSHGLALGRVTGCRFDAAAITNLTQDHLDFHGNMEAYAEAKSLLFRSHLKAGGVGVVNLDDPLAERFLAATREGGARTLGVARRRDVAADVRVESAEVSLSGVRARLSLPSGPLDLALPLVGDFNVENLLVAVGIAVGLGVAPADIVRGVASCPQVPGRMERVASDPRRAPVVLVDYAHTPDAVEKVLRTVRTLTQGRLVAVFGCGGDRDRSKRPKMGRAATQRSDVVILTSDNPRTEDPLAILKEVEVGVKGALDPVRVRYQMIPDRRHAIETAVREAKAGDMVLIAGKGHEDYQIVGTTKHHFDDREVAREAIAKLRK